MSETPVVTAEENRRIMRQQRHADLPSHRGTTWAALQAQHPTRPAPEGIGAECPRCHAAPGVMCVTQSGRLLAGWASHGSRAVSR
jgi:hypothetical protein